MNGRGDTATDLVLGGFLFFIIAIVVLSFQLFYYLKNGDWLMLSMIDGLIYIQKRPSDWLFYPDDWVGVHKLLERTPLGLGLIIAGIVWIASFGFLGQSYPTFRNAENGKRKRSTSRRKKTELKDKRT